MKRPTEGSKTAENLRKPFGREQQYDIKFEDAVVFRQVGLGLQVCYWHHGSSTSTERFA